MQKGQLPDVANPTKANQPENTNYGKPPPSPPATCDDEEGDDSEEETSDDENGSDEEVGDEPSEEESEQESEEESEDESEEEKKKAPEKGKKSNGETYDGWIYRRIQKECSNRGLPARLKRDQLVANLLEDDRQQKAASGFGPAPGGTDGNPPNTEKDKGKDAKKRNGKGKVPPGSNNTGKGASRGGGTGKAPGKGSGTGKGPTGGNGTGKPPAKAKPKKASPKLKSGVTNADTVGALGNISKGLFNKMNEVVQQLENFDETQQTETRPGRGAGWREIGKSTGSPWAIDHQNG